MNEWTRRSVTAWLSVNHVQADTGSCGVRPTPLGVGVGDRSISHQLFCTSHSAIVNQTKCIFPVSKRFYEPPGKQINHRNVSLLQTRQTVIIVVVPSPDICSSAAIDPCRLTGITTVVHCNWSEASVSSQEMLQLWQHLLSGRLQHSH